MSTYGRHKKLFFSWKDVSAEQSRVWLHGCRPIETPKPISSNRGSSDAIRGSKFFSSKKAFAHRSTTPCPITALHSIAANCTYERQWALKKYFPQLQIPPMALFSSTPARLPRPCASLLALCASRFALCALLPVTQPSDFSNLR